MSLKPFEDLAPKAGRRRFARPHHHHHIWLGKSFGSHLDLGAALLGSRQGLSRDSIPSVADLLISLLRVPALMPTWFNVRPLPACLSQDRSRI
jgi:hypothetical protein